jgi:phosphoadenosine phosphosulfate reductase
VRSDESAKRQGRDVFGVMGGGSYSKATFFSLDHTDEVHHEALEREKEPNGTVWDCTLIKVMRDRKDTVVNPIYEWSDKEVWDYLRAGGYPYNPMYDMGYHRVGCIGCPLATYKQKMKEFADFPTYKKLYIAAFDEMLRVRREAGKDDVVGKDGSHCWKTGEDVFLWWIEEWKRNVKGQMTIDDFFDTED